jgi:hypothetical protein
MVFNDELCGDRRPEAQRKWSCAIQFFIRECANCICRFMAVPAQEFERRGFRYLSLLVSVLGIQLGDDIPCDVPNGLPAGDRSRDINLDRVHAGNMV